MISKNILKLIFGAIFAGASIVLIIIGAKLAFVPKNYSNTENSPPQTENSESSNASKWESKIDEQASVAVEVTPLDLSPQSAEYSFNILINTHTVELDQDIAAVAVLVDDQGKEYRPLKWEGAPPGGHHREGVLTFKSIIPAPKSIELKISGVGGAERSFTWHL